MRRESDARINITYRESDARIIILYRESDARIDSAYRESEARIIRDNAASFFPHDEQKRVSYIKEMMDKYDKETVRKVTNVDEKLVN